MKFALHFANITLPKPEDAKRLAIAAEAAGFESLIVVEHVVWPTDYSSTYPYAPSVPIPKFERSNFGIKGTLSI